MRLTDAQRWFFGFRLAYLGWPWDAEPHLLVFDGQAPTKD